MAKSNTKTILVTGASSGIGEATAFYLAKKGYKVIGTSRDKARLISLKDQSKANGNEVDIEELDINSETSVTRAIHGQSLTSVPYWEKFPLHLTEDMRRLNSH